MIRVFIVDDHQIFRDGLRVLLNAAPDLEVAGEADSGQAALSQMAEAQPDVVLMDIQMPGENGIDITRQLKRRFPHIQVLMLTMFEDDQSVFAAMTAGASGYTLKGVNHLEMLRSIRTVAAGGAVFSPRIASRMIDYFQHVQHQSKPDIFPELSERELDVLRLIASEHDNKTIAAKLFLSTKTVRNYVSQIMKKLSVSERSLAAEKARQAGL